MNYQKLLNFYLDLYDCDSGIYTLKVKDVKRVVLWYMATKSIHKAMFKVYPYIKSDRYESDWRDSLLYSEYNRLTREFKD